MISACDGFRVTFSVRFNFWVVILRAVVRAGCRCHTTGAIALPASTYCTGGLLEITVPAGWALNTNN